VRKREREREREGWRDGETERRREEETERLGETVVGSVGEPVVHQTLLRSSGLIRSLSFISWTAFGLRRLSKPPQPGANRRGIRLFVSNAIVQLFLSQFHPKMLKIFNNSGFALTVKLNKNNNFLL
jgi:hypothetical protein